MLAGLGLVVVLATTGCGPRKESPASAQPTPAASTPTSLVASPGGAVAAKVSTELASSTADSSTGAVSAVATAAVSPPMVATNDVVHSLPPLPDTALTPERVRQMSAADLAARRVEALTDLNRKLERLSVVTNQTVAASRAYDLAALSSNRMEEVQLRSAIRDRIRERVILDAALQGGGGGRK